MKLSIVRIASFGQALLLAAACSLAAPTPPLTTSKPSATAPAMSGSQPEVGPAGSPSLTDSKITIGVINDQSLVYAELPTADAVKAVQMAVDDFEARHGKGSLGGPIDVIGADLQNRPELAHARAQEFYDRLGVDLILDVPTSSAALAIAGVARDKKRLYINVTAATTGLTGAQCNRYTFHYAYDTWMLANGTGAEVTRLGGKTWYIIYPNYAYGQDIDRSFQAAIKAAGGEVLASDGTPFPNPSNNFSTFLQKATALKPNVLATMNANGELANVVKQYNELKLKDHGVTLAVGLLFDTDIHALGADAFAGALYTTPWVWNMDARAREWADRYTKIVGGNTRPTFAHAGNYSAAMHYLEAVRQAGTDGADVVVKALEGQAIDDFFIRNGRIRPEDHRVTGDKFLAQVKPQSEAREPWDYATILSTIPADRAFRPVADARAAGCNMQ